MRRLLLLSFGLFLFALPSYAQSVDASVSYSYFRLGGSGGINQNGISGSVAYNPNRWLGAVGDFGGYHASPGGISLNTYTYLVGGYRSSSSSRFAPSIGLRRPAQLRPDRQLHASLARLRRPFLTPSRTVVTGPVGPTVSAS